jgi:hypothetical protein
MGIPAIKYDPVFHSEVKVPFRTDAGEIIARGVWRGDRLESVSGLYLVVDFGIEMGVVNGEYESSGFNAILIQSISPDLDEDGQVVPLAQPFVQRYKQTTLDESRSATGGVGIDSAPLTGFQLLPVSPRRP